MNARNESDGKGKRGGPAWLGKRQAAGKAKTARDWTKFQPKDSSAEYQYKFKRTMLWIGCAVLFLVFVIYLIPPKNTPLVILRASRYPLQMPPLALAAEDEHFLKRVSPSNLPLRQAATFRYIGSSDNQTDEEGTPQRFLAQLKTVKPSGPGWFSRNDAVVIYISAHGLVNEQGQACLVPPNADAFNTSRWLPLVKLLKDISALPNLQRSRKLVILDCNRISMKWRSGVLDNRFADQLPTVVDQVDDPNLYVLNSTSPGQIAWAAPELRGSVFGHYVGLGLRGDASHEFGRDYRRGVVSLLELQTYLTAHVDDYVQQRRGVRQTPLLIGGADGLPVTRDVPIVSADLWQAWRGHQELKSPYDVLGKAKELIEPTDQRPSALQLAWQAYQQRAAGHDDNPNNPLPATWRRGYVLDPIRWASLEQRLLALEDRLFAGEDYQEGLGNQFAALAEELAAANWQEFPETQSATNLRLLAWKQKADAATDPTQADATPVDYSELYNSWLKAMPEEQARITFPDAERPRAVSELLARFGLDDLHADEVFEKFDRDRLSSALRFLRLANDKAIAPTTELIPSEAHLLKLLSSNTSSAAERMLPEVIRARSLAEQAATPLDVRAHYPLELLVNQADAERRAAEDAFFLGDQLSLDGTGSAETNEAAVQRSAERRLLKANGFAAKSFWDESSNGYLAARKWGEELEQMFSLRDEIWATLPHLAEWYFRRWRLELTGFDDAANKTATAEFSEQIETLNEVLDENILLAEQIERILLKRDSEVELRAELHSAHESFQTLADKWQSLRALITADSESRGKSEISFQTADAVRHIEQVMQTPLFNDARVKGLLSKYHNTLSNWATNALPNKPPSAAASDPRLVDPKPSDREATFLAGYRQFLIRYHKVLTHEFRLPYEQHRETLKLEREDALVIDQRLRQEQTKDRTLWQTLQNVLSDYDAALQGKPVDVGPTTPAVQARRELSIWDRRVRASAFWLGGFNQNLVPDPIGIPTPTAWLRDVDHWHLSCWHGYRTLQDFWGNGLPYDRTPQFFDLATQQCAKAATSKQLPFQYDLPGGNVEELYPLLAARVIAHQAGLELQVPNVQTLDSQTGPLQFEAKTTQRIESVDHKPANFPAGDAGFYVGRAGVLEPLDDTLIRYADNKSLQRYPVKLVERLREQPGPRGISCFIDPSKLEKPPVSLEGRVWYRGHLWSQPFELYHSAPAQGIRFVHRREPYSAPTVQVGGDDAAAGAVMFVFDCSSSMTNGDGRFAAAKTALQDILKDLKLAPPGGLQIGLVAYGHRTAHRAGYFPRPNEKMFYKADKLWDDPDNLTPDGVAAAKMLGPAFADLYPHPDRDIQTLLKPGLGWAATIDQQLDSLDINRCFGVTPLYASITRAIQEVNAVKGVESRQVIVLSDGVNIPNNCDLSLDKILVKGLQQNNEDIEELTALVKKSKVSVRVILFGGVKPGLEKAQLDALVGVGDKPQYVVDAVPSPKAIKKSIAAAFVKPDFQVVSADKDRAPLGRMQFNETWTFPQWPTAGDLLPPQPHQVIVRGPRLMDPLSQNIQLSGGEALRLEYDAGAASLLFVPDLLDPFDQEELAAFGNILPPTRPIIAEAVKPLVGSQAGETRPTTFRLRLRSKANSQFVAWPRHVWAEIRPLNADAKYKGLVFQIADVKFEDKTRTPVLQFPVPGWPIAVEGAAIDLWVRYGNPPPLFPAVNISPADAQLPTIVGSKYGLEGVEFTIRQQLIEGTTRKVVITEQHPNDTPLARLYRTRVQLSPPADMVERLYVPPSGSSPKSEVIHTFHYSTQAQLGANLSLEVNTAEQIKDGSLKASLEISNWNR